MAFKYFIVCAAFAVANAGYIAQPQLAYSSAADVSHVYSSLHQPAAHVATYASAPAVGHVYASAPAKTITTYSSAPAYQTAYAAGPAIHTSYASPALATYSAPIAKTIQYSPSVTYSSPAIGSSSQSTVRSFDGTVSQYAKAVDTAFSSVRKQDTRITNNVYQQAPVYAAKTLAYAAAPAPVYAAKTISYSAPAHALSYAAPAHSISYGAPAHSLSYAAPAHGLSYAAPAHGLSYAAPAHGLSYAAHAPVIAAKSLHYTAAPLASHVSFEGLGAHYAW